MHLSVQSKAETRREIDSLILVDGERSAYPSGVISVHSSRSSKKAGLSVRATAVSYISTFVSKLRPKLRTSQLALPTEAAVSSATMVFACKKPLSYE